MDFLEDAAGIVLPLQQNFITKHFVEKTLVINNNSSQPIIAIISSDPNATQIAKLGGGVGTSGANFNYVAQNKSQVVSKTVVQPKHSTTLPLQTNMVYLTVVRKKSNGTYDVIRENRSLSAGDSWTANDSLFLHPISNVQKI